MFVFDCNEGLCPCSATKSIIKKNSTKQENQTRIVHRLISERKNVFA